MKIITKCILSVVMIMVSFLSISQETFINENWNLINGFIGQELKIASRLTPNGELVYLSNHIQNGASDIYMTKVDPDGNILWSITCPSTQGLEDYGTALEIAPNGDIYVCAAQNNGSNMDFWIAKYLANGVLQWQNNFAGTGNGDDVPLDIILDDNNNPIVAGYVWNGIYSNDVAAIKLSHANGSILWSYINFESLEQQAYSIELDQNDDVIIGGISSDSLIYGGIQIQKLDGDLGSQLGINTIYSSQTGIDVLRKIEIRQNGDIIVAGSSNLNSTNSDLMILSLDANLQLNWETYKDRDSGMDEVLDMTIDDSDEIICTGYTSKASGGQELWIAKVNYTNGSFAWEYEKTALLDTDYVRGKSVVTDADNNVFVTGTEFREGREQFLTIALNEDGEFLWARFFNESNQSEDFAEKIQVDEFGQVYVTGISIENNQPAISTVSYTYNEQEIQIVVDAQGNPIRVDDQLIVQFSPEHIIPSVFSDTRTVTGYLNKFVDTEILNSLQGLTGIDWGRLNSFKAFRRSTMADTLSVTRLGDTIRTSDYWATLVIDLPAESDEVAISTLVTDLMGINYATANNIVVSFNPNDSLYITNNQLGLHPNSIYPNAHINVEDAWDQGVVGRDYVKVGIVDSPMDWSHQEFGSSQILQFSQVTGGYDFYNGTDLSFFMANNTFGTSTHGTKVGGIIGAYRNNSAGTSGIAGGDLAQLQKGVQLISLGISKNTNQFAPMNLVGEAIKEGSLQTTTNNYGYGLHLQNFSWGNNTNDPYLEEAIDECWRNHCIPVAAIGNSNNFSPNYPASYADKKIINVIASGTDGERKNGSSNGYGNWGSSYGWDGSLNYTKVEPDFMAPGVVELVSTTTAHWDTTNPVSSYCGFSSPMYRCFQGTSAAAPIVTGVAALLYSEHVPVNGYPNVLSTEDVEQLLQRTAADRDTVVGYDYNSGFGLIDAGKAISESTDPYYVQHNHYDYNDASENWINQQYGVLEIFGYDSNLVWQETTHDLVDIFRFTWIIEDTLPAGHVVVDAWNVEAGWRTGQNLNTNPFTILDDNTGEAIVNLNVIPGSNIVHGYAHTDLYKITDIQNGSPVSVTWYPFHPSELRFMYSIYANSDPTASVETLEKDEEFSLYPNPNTGEFSLVFNSNLSDNVSITVVDASGRIVANQEFSGIQIGINSLEMNTSYLRQGVYYCTLRTGEGLKTLPFVKSN